MEVDVGEVNLCGGHAGIHRVMDRHAGVHGAMDGRAGDKKGSGWVGCEVKYAWGNWVGNCNVGMWRIGR